jgi:outer membrane scaffolding protein for murein synthesis (MipA/OmpV family)
VFIELNSADGLTTGWHLSDTPMLQYGPLLSLHPSEQRGDTRDGRRGVDGEAGAFFSYQPLYNFDLNARFLAGGGERRRGLAGHAGATLSQPLAAHHDLSLSAGLSLANQPYLQSLLGVTARQALDDDLRPYRPRAGLLNLSVSLGWHWELGAKWALDTDLRYGRLAPNVADSPLVGQRGRAVVTSALDYHY